MDATDVKSLLADTRKRMDGHVEFVRKEVAQVRTGRASTGLLDTVMVDAYGSKLPLNQVAGLSIPEPTMIVAQPFDGSLMGAIERAIRAADLGLNPANDGKVVRIPIPPLNDERRRELSKHVHKLTEEGRNQVRTARRDANDRLKKLLKDKAVSEDDMKGFEKKVQELTDKFVNETHAIQKKKDAEVMEV